MDYAHGQPLRAASDRCAGRSAVRAGLGGSERRTGRDRADPAAVGGDTANCLYTDAKAGQAGFCQSDGIEAGATKGRSGTTAGATHDGAAETAGAFGRQARAGQKDGCRPPPSVAAGQAGKGAAARGGACVAGDAAGPPAAASTTVLCGRLPAAATVVRRHAVRLFRGALAESDDALVGTVSAPIAPHPGPPRKRGEGEQRHRLQRS